LIPSQPSEAGDDPGKALNQRKRNEKARDGDGHDGFPSVRINFGKDVCHLRNEHQPCDDGQATHGHRKPVDFFVHFKPFLIELPAQPLPLANRVSLRSLA
jgi:hypothetical protein